MAIIRTIHEELESPLLLKLKSRDIERAEKVIDAYYQKMKKMQIKKPRANRANSITI